MPQDERNYYAEPEADDPSTPPTYRPMAAAPASGASIASVVCGALFCCTPIPSVLAVILGFIGIRQTRNPYVGGRGLSITGLVMGVIGVGLWCVLGAIGYLGYHFYITETAEVRTVSNQFIQDLHDGKVDAALARCMPGMDQKELVDASAAMKPWGQFNEIVAEPRPISNDGMLRWEIEGTAIFTQARKPLSMRLVKEGPTYRVERFLCK